MNIRNPVVLVLFAIALVWVLQMLGLFGIFLLAALGATMTEGLRTGALPFAPAISRTVTPVKFWVILSAGAAIILLNVFHLLLKR